MELDLTLELLSDGISEGLFVCRVDEKYSFGNCRIWNGRMTEITGYTLEEINEKFKGKDLFTVGSQYDKFRDWIKRIYAVKKDVVQEFEILHKDGSRRIIAASGSVQVVDTKSEYIIALVRDISQNKMMEDNLRIKDNLLRLVTENIIDMIAITDLDYRCKFCTPSVQSILGYSFEELLDRYVVDLVHPDEKKRALSELGMLKINLKGAVERFRFRHAAGSYIWIEIAGRTLLNEAGEADGYIFCCRDISSRIKMENALRKSEYKFREVFNNTSDALFLNKIEDSGLLGRFIEVNDAACNLLGYSRKELCIMSPFDVSPEAPLEIGYEVVRKLKETGRINFQTEFCTKGGSKVPVEASCVLLKLEEEEVVLSVLHDVTERITSENKLRKSKERYRWLLDNLPYAIYVQDGDNFVFSNKIGLEYFGLKSFKEIIGRKVDEIIKPHADYKDEYKEYTQRIGNEMELPLHEAKFIRLSDGKTLDLETAITTFPFYEESNTLIVTRDISERKRAEELQRAMDEKNRLLNEAFEYERLRTEFFANISHELRTPINVIFSSLQLINLKFGMLEQSFQGSGMVKHIDVMKQNCYRLIRLINNLIDVTKIDAGYFELTLCNNNIVGIVEDIVLSVAEYVENKKITLLFDTEVEEKITACDPDKIERIILNLISNAVKFTEPGGSININIVDRPESIAIKVSDTGIGIPAEKQRAIFDRFVQVDKSLNRASEGSGIGLSLVKSLVEMHNGHISVTSETGKGSEFIIELPVKVLSGSEQIASKENHNMQGKIEKINIEFSDIYF